MHVCAWTRPRARVPTCTHARARKHAHRPICNTYCFSTATVVSRTRLSVMLHVHCLSCFLFYVIRIREANKKEIFIQKKHHVHPKWNAKKICARQSPEPPLLWPCYRHTHCACSASAHNCDELASVVSQLRVPTSVEAVTSKLYQTGSFWRKLARLTEHQLFIIAIINAFQQPRW